MYAKKTGEKETAVVVTDVAVINEDDPLGDHTSYWRNYHQVIRRIVKEILHEDKQVAKFVGDEKADLRRKHVALWLTVPRLVLMWLPLPVLPLPLYYLLSDQLHRLSVRLTEDGPFADDRLLVGFKSLVNDSGLWPEQRHALVAAVVIFVAGYLLYTLWKLIWQMKYGGMNDILKVNDRP